jgi:hypothetical protein
MVPTILLKEYIMPKRAAKKGKAPNDFLKKGKDEQRPLPFQKKGDDKKTGKRSRVCHATAHTKEGRDKTGVRRALHEVECGQGISHTKTAARGSLSTIPRQKEISEPPTITKRIVGGLLMAGAI